MSGDDVAAREVADAALEDAFGAWASQYQRGDVVTIVRFVDGWHQAEGRASRRKHLRGASRPAYLAGRRAARAYARAQAKEAADAHD